MSAETDYGSLADLREVLTADDPDRRANAYGAVMGADVDVSAVLAPDPDRETIEAIVDAGIIPPRGPGGRDGRPASDRDERVIELLEDIRDALTAEVQ